MAGMRIVAAYLAAAGLTLAPAVAAELTADEIMARVAANQERSQSLRAAMVYEQEVLVRLIGAKRTFREERHLFTVTPTTRGTEKTLIRFEGKLRHKGEMLPYAEPHYEHRDIDLDADLAEVLLDFVSGNSRDGIDDHLFPLSAKAQRNYNFHLLGEEELDGRQVYRIAFSPREKGIMELDDGRWKGEAFIHQEQFQPVYVTTDFAWQVPLAIRTLLGTNVKQVGFALHYQEVEDGLWFPVSYGGEFRIRVLFFYGRTATISMVNRAFQRTDVQSQVRFQEPEAGGVDP